MRQHKKDRWDNTVTLKMDMFLNQLFWGTERCKGLLEAVLNVFMPKFKSGTDVAMAKHTEAVAFK